MTKEELAAKLDGIDIRDSIRSNYEPEAKEAGLVIAFGGSDDLLEFAGAIYDEVGAWNGTTEPLDDKGLITHECDCDECPHEQRKRDAAAHWIKAEWCPVDGDCSWRISASVPTATFNIMEDGDIFCRGIVFAMEDLK